MRTDFITTVPDVSIDNLPEQLGVPKVDIDTDAKAEINWTIDAETRGWGIKYIGISVNKVTVGIEWKAYLGELTEEEKAKLIEAGGTEGWDIDGYIEIDSSDGEWEIKDNFNFEYDGYCRPGIVNVDFKEKLIEIE